MNEKKGLENKREKADIRIDNSLLSNECMVHHVVKGVMRYFKGISEPLDWQVGR